MTFIVLEGGEGVGKSTQARLLAETLRSRGLAVDQTYEPGGTPEGLELRRKLLHGPAPDPDQELAWMLEDRRLHLTQRIEPDLAQGVIVICDRFTPSTIAYQGVGRGLGIDYVERRCLEITGNTVPDLVVVLDLPDDVAETRVAASRDRFEQESAAFHAAVRNAYRDLAADRGWVVIDATGTPEHVAARVSKAVEPYL
jgi:dTMP kinase